MIDQFANVDDGLGLPNVPVDLSARMREIRARQGLKQSEIARRMGLDPSIPSLWEQGKRPVPASRIPALAEALGVAVTELLEGVSGVAAPVAPSPAAAAPAPRVAPAAEISSPAPPAPVQRTSPDRAPLMNMLAPSALVEDPEPAQAEREIEVAPPVRAWAPAARPPLNGWIPDGWEPGDRVQDISPALPDGYWLDPVRLERKVAKDTMRSRLCEADRKLIGDKDVPGAALAERLFQHCSKDAAFTEAKVPLMEGIFRSLLAAEYGGLTADALVETLQPRSSVPITRPLLRKLGVSARTYPFTWVDREIFGREQLTLLLARADLARLLDVGAVIEACEAAFTAYSAGQTVTPLRVGVEPPGENGVLLAMPCAVAEPAALGTKVVSVFRDNPSRGLPTITSIYLLSDSATGTPLAVMDGTYLTGARTAAGSAVATRLLAREGARTLGVFGNGVQAQFHVEAIRRVRGIERVLVSATSASKAEAFCVWVREATGLEAVAATAEEASAADVLAVCTTSSVPVVVGSAVQPGAHLNAVGAFVPTAREMPTEVVARARVYVDTRSGCFSESGDLLIPVQEGAFSLDQVVGEVGEVVLERVPGRQSAADVTIYKSVGAAFLDAATARLAFDLAVQQGVGQSFSFS